MRRSRRAARACVTLVVSLLTLAAAPLFGVVSAQQDESKTHQGTELSLSEVVSRGLRHSNNLRQAKEAVSERRGAFLTSSGMFDRSVFFEGNFSFREEHLLRDDLNPEIRRRVPLEFASIATANGPPGAFDRAAIELLRELPEDGSLLLDDCRLGQTRFLFELSEEDNGLGGTATLCLNSEGFLQGIVLDIDGLENPADLAVLLRVLDALDDDFAQDIREGISDILRGLASQLRLISTALRFQRERLGGLPEARQALDLRAELGHRFLFRNGIMLTSSLGLTGTEDNFADKPLNPAFGGAPSANTFTTTLGMNLFVPLGKGRGEVATGGPEQAAQATMRAEQRLFAHTASEEALAMVEAYWDVAAAHERWRLLRASEEIQEQVLGSTRDLVNAEELPAAELDRIQARYSNVRAQVAASQREEVNARMDLAEAMGISIDRLDDAPLAADTLPGDSDVETDPELWVQRALDNRKDLAAAEETRGASQILTRTAEANLRHQFDLSLNLSLSGFHETLDDRIYDFEGYWDAISGRLAGPSFGIGFRWTVPFRNSKARGRLLQAQAALTQSEIKQGDLQRAIRLRISDLLAALDRQQERLAQLVTSIEYLDESLRASLELFHAGDMTLIDALTTEQQVTDARLALVDARREIGVLEARLLFESGELLDGPADLDELDAAKFELARTWGSPDSESGP